MTMKRLFRSRRQSIIGGVAGGLAEYFEVDVVLVRLLWVLAAFVGGGGVLAYIVAWIIIPEEPSPSLASKPGKKPGRETSKETPHQASQPSEEAKKDGILEGEGDQDEALNLEETGQMDEESKKNEEQHSARRRRNAGLLLIGLGFIFLARQVLPAYFFQFSWPLLLILLGLFFLMRDGREKS